MIIDVSCELLDYLMGIFHPCSIFYQYQFLRGMKLTNINIPCLFTNLLTLMTRMGLVVKGVSN